MSRIEMAKKKRPAVTIRVSDSGSTSRRKRRLTSDEVAAKRAAIAEHVPPDRAKIIAAMARSKIVGRESKVDKRRIVEEEAKVYDVRVAPHKAKPTSQDPYRQSVDRMERSEAVAKDGLRRRGSYLSAMAGLRAAAAGQEGRQAEQDQADAYRALGVDLKAGFEGRPPAFRITKREKTDSGETLVTARNIARDPIHILRTQGLMSARQHTAAVALTDLFEQHASIGLRAMAFAEAIDGGKTPDVSAYAMAIASRMAAWERTFTEHDRGLLKAVAIDGQTISALARAGTYGANRSRVRDKLSVALERLADFFDVR